MQSKYDEKYILRPYGLVNYSSICWFNSCLQCLTSLPLFNKHLIDNIDQYKISNNKFAILLHDFILKVLNSNDTIMNAHHIGQQLVQQADGQHDLINGASCANSAIIAIQDILNIDSIFSVSVLVSITCNKCYNCISIRDETNYLRFDTHININSSSAFVDSLRQQIVYLNDYKCNLCGFTGSTKKTDLKRIGDILVIPMHIKTLIKYVQWFPEYMSFPCPDNTTINYKLCSIIEHSGGHYWAHIYRKQWFIANDTNCEFNSYTINESPFILFYHRI